MISILQSGDKYEVRFPYDSHIVELVKQAPGRTWNPDGKFWTIPAARLGFLLAQFKGTQYEKQVVIQSNENINVNASIDGPNQIPNIDVSEYQYRVQKGLYPYKHQIDSLKVAKWRYENGLRSGFILADQPGAAKTCQVMNIGLYMRQFHNMRHCLIIACVNSAKFNWIDDIVKHTDGEEVPYLLGTRLTRKGTIRKQEATTQEKLDDLLSMTMYNDGSTPLPFFLVVNIEAIRMRVGKKYPFADRLIEMIHSRDIGMIALDEIHRNCLDYDTCIQTDIGDIRIGELVESRLDVNVLSYDVDSGSMQYRPVTQWHAYTTDRYLIELTIEDESTTRTIRCTPDHLFYTRNRGWVTASDLTEYDEIISINSIEGQ